MAFDAYPLGHRKGSSHGSSRIFRRAYLEPDYVAMSGRALALWRQLEQATGRALLVTTGGLDHRSGHEIQALFDVLSAHSVVCALLSAREATERWPHLHFEAEVLYQPEAGVIDPELTMAETTRLRSARPSAARGRGRGHRTGRLRVKIKLKDRTLQARRVVCAVGPWTPTLLGRVAQLPSLTVTQQTVFHFARRQSGFDPWPIVFHEVTAWSTDCPVAVMAASPAT